MNVLKEKLLPLLSLSDDTQLCTPPDYKMGDFAFSCFELAKKQGKSPAEVAKELAENIEESDLVDKVEALGPYVNFYLNSSKLSELVFEKINEKDFGKNEIGKGENTMVEFAHPNTHKAFHIGHLRNIITGESIVRILEKNEYNVTRANYQGDVGMHIAKCLWGINTSLDEYEKVKNLDNKKKATFLGEVYAKGGQAFEKSEQSKEEIIDINEKIYSHDESIMEMYQTTRQWSLDYFDSIYKRVDSHFDKLYFESEVFEDGRDVVLKFLEQGVFKKSDGAIIFEGSKYGLHDRVFINSKGFPTYEAKDMALAKKQFSEYSPQRIIHVVGKEQTEYFKVIFKALEYILPESKGKEYHLDYGWVTLKSGKMSSRTGQVVLGEWLLDEVEKKVANIMKDSEIEQKSEITKKVALAAVKYAFLKTGVKHDIKFDLEESVSLSGDSGPYLLYIVARIKSILRKVNGEKIELSKVDIKINEFEKQLLIRLAEYPDITRSASKELDPSKIAQYLFSIAQSFNRFYDACPILQEKDQNVRDYRIKIIKGVEKVMSNGLSLLGVEVVERM